MSRLIHRFIILIFILWSSHEFLQAQSRHILGTKSAWSIESTIIRTPSPRHTRFYEETKDVYAYFSPTISFEGRIAYHRFLGKRTGISAGLTASAYPFTMRSFATKEFLNFDYDLDFFPGGAGGSYIHYGGPYVELRPGISRYYKVGKKLFLSPEANLNLVYFIPYYLGVGFGVPDTVFNTGASKMFFSSNTDYNLDGKIFLAPELSLNASYQVGKIVLLSVKCFAKYSNKTVLKGTYQIIGEQETLEGSFTKKYSDFGLSFGIILLSNKT